MIKMDYKKVNTVKVRNCKGCETTTPHMLLLLLLLSSWACFWHLKPEQVHQHEKFVTTEWGGTG